MFLGERTQEFCTVYNMVQLADYLSCFTGTHEYLDYIENNHLVPGAFQSGSDWVDFCIQSYRKELLFSCEYDIIGL